MRRMLAGAALGAALTLIVVGLAFAHGGGLDAKGGHWDRKTGTYHVHRAPAAPQALAPQAVAPQALAAPARDTTPAGLMESEANADPRREALIALLLRKGVFTQAELDAELARRH